jgi:2,3-bisphosphoglycerate-dependent phosphoglycerate mutase
MKTIYLIRHAESEGNIGMHFQGVETSLTEKGREQAAFVAKRCSRLKVDALITSDMRRARETAEVISQAIRVPLETSNLFSERRRPSSIIGVPMDNMEAKKIDDAWTRGLLTGEGRVGDGENYADVAARSEQALQFLANHPAENILVVSHGFFMCMLLARSLFHDALTPAEFRRIFNGFHISNTGISILKHGGEWAEWGVYAWNDHAHLG